MKRPANGNMGTSIIQSMYCGIIPIHPNGSEKKFLIRLYRAGIENVPETNEESVKIFLKFQEILKIELLLQKTMLLLC